MEKAYLVAHLRIRIRIPYVTYVGIYSFPAKQLTRTTRDEFIFDISEEEGVNYEEARKKLIQSLTTSYLSWVKHLIPVSFL